MTVLNFGRSATVPQEFAVLLVTLEEAHRGPGSFARAVAAENGVSGQRVPVFVTKTRSTRSVS